MVARFAVFAGLLVLLTGFSEAKRDALIKNCTKHGNERQACVCSFDLIEKRVGDEFMEAMYLQVTGKIVAYEKALMKLATQNPQVMDKAASAEQEAKRRCLN